MGGLKSIRLLIGSAVAGAVIVMAGLFVGASLVSADDGTPTPSHEQTAPGTGTGSGDATRDPADCPHMGTDSGSSGASGGTSGGAGFRGRGGGARF